MSRFRERIYITHRKTHGQPLSMNAKCPVVGEHSTMDHHFAVTNRRMSLILSVRIVANSSPPGIHCNIIRESAKQNLVSLQI
ncbi:hypothetical protein QQG55_53720 [Brugia pahangi]